MDSKLSISKMPVKILILSKSNQQFKENIQISFQDNKSSRLKLLSLKMERLTTSSDINQLTLQFIGTLFSKKLSSLTKFPKFQEINLRALRIWTFIIKVSNIL